MSHSVKCPPRCEHASRGRNGIVTYPATVEYLANRDRIKAVSVVTPLGAYCAHCGENQYSRLITSLVLTDGVVTQSRTLCSPCVIEKYL